MIDTHFATGHLYGLNLRTRALVHLIHCDGETKRKEHDMGALKRLNPNELRMGAPKGRKVLWIWDKAGISFGQWHKWKQGSGVYFLSRAKENMNLTIAPRPWDGSDPVNAGILKDGYLVDGPQTPIRLVVFQDPISGDTFEFITNLMNVEPGVIAQLYRMRWDIEKSFDALKNQFGETKAWASGATAKTMQATFLAIATNLVTIFEHYLELCQGIRNTPERNRKAKRLKEERRQLRKAGLKAPALYCRLVRFTKTSVKFIRWIRMHLWRATCWSDALARLCRIYASL